MMLIDVNVLVYAHRRGSPNHEPMREWLKAAPLGNLRGLCRLTGVKGNLVADACFAALTIESGSEWITTDRDYARFPKLKWRQQVSRMAECGQMGT